jgi:cytidylate kinase
VILSSKKCGFCGGPAAEKWGRRRELLADGRDRYVVFPKAELKIFMTADNSIRVERLSGIIR